MRFEPRLRRACNWRLLGSLLLLVLGVTTSWLAASRDGYDFIHLYLAKQSIVTGAPIYDPAWRADFVPQTCGMPAPAEGVFYPPSTGVAMLPLAPLSCAGFRHAVHVLLILSVIVGVYSLVKLTKSDARPETWIWVSGLILLSACVRWGMTHLQSAPLIFGALALEMALLHGRRPALAALVATFASALKFTMAPPFVVLLFVHRRFGAVVGVTAAVALLNALGFWRMGGVSAFAEYRAAIGSLESFGTMNSPNPWDPHAGIRMDWVSLFTGLTGDASVARMLALVLALFIGLWLLWAAYRLPRPLTPADTAAFALPLVCTNLMITYHHAYDVTVVWAPLLAVMLLFGTSSEPRPPHWAALLATPLIAIMALMPINMTQRILTALLGDMGMVVIRFAFPVATTMMLVAGIVYLGVRLPSKPRLQPESA